MTPAMPEPAKLPAASDLPAIAVFSVHHGVPGDLAVLAWQAAAESERRHFRAMANAAVTAAGPEGAYTQTRMRLSTGESWQVRTDVWDRDDDTWLRCDNGVPVATLRRVGWLDQKGRVWTAGLPVAEFDGGSLTPLLIDAREDGH